MTNSQAILEVVDELEVSELREIKAIIYGVKWYRYGKGAPRELFNRVRLLAVLDLWTEMPAEDKIYAVGTEDLNLIRQLPLYERVSAALERVLENWAKKRTPEQWVDESADQAFRELATQSITGKTSEVRRLAAREISDRALPKQSRNTQQLSDGRDVVVPLAVAEQLLKSIMNFSAEKQREQEEKPKEITVHAQSSGAPEV